MSGDAARRPPIAPSRLSAIVGAVVAIVVPSEGLRQVAYRDPPGVLTACYGDTHDIDPKHVYSKAECLARLSSEVTATVVAIDACMPGAPDRVVIAFSDAAYNLGTRIACDRQRSTAARRLYVRDWVGACNQLPLWDKATIGGHAVTLPGLMKRRALERSICLGQT